MRIDKWKHKAEEKVNYFKEIKSDLSGLQTKTRLYLFYSYFATTSVARWCDDVIWTEYRSDPDLISDLSEEELDMAGDVELVFATVSLQVSVQHTVALYEDPAQVLRVRRVHDVQTENRYQQFNDLKAT